MGLTDLHWKKDKVENIFDFSDVTFALGDGQSLEAPRYGLVGTA